MPAYNQLLNDVKVDRLAISSAKSAAIDMLGYRSVVILANFSDTSGTVTFKLQESPTTTDGDFVDLVPAYVDNGATAAVPEGSTVLTATGTATSASRFLAMQFNRPGREGSVGSLATNIVSRRYLRIVATAGTCTFAVALKYNADMTPVAQTDLINFPVAGTN